MHCSTLTVEHQQLPRGAQPAHRTAQVAVVLVHRHYAVHCCWSVTRYVAAAHKIVNSCCRCDV